MNREPDDPAELHRSDESDSAELQCRRAGSIVGMILIEKFQLPAMIVDGLLEEAYETYRIFWKSLREPQEWVIRRVVEKARTYMDLRGIDGGPDSEEDTPHILELIRTQAALDTLPRDSRAALRMLCVEGKSWERIAEELNVTVKYADKLVTEALTLLRRWRPRPEPREK